MKRSDLEAIWKKFTEGVFDERKTDRLDFEKAVEEVVGIEDETGSRGVITPVPAAFYVNWTELANALGLRKGVEVHDVVSFGSRCAVFNVKLFEMPEVLEEYITRPATRKYIYEDRPLFHLKDLQVPPAQEEESPRPPLSLDELVDLHVFGHVYRPHGDVPAYTTDDDAAHKVVDCLLCRRFTFTQAKDSADRISACFVDRGGKLPRGAWPSAWTWPQVVCLAALRTLDVPDETIEQAIGKQNSSGE